MSDDKWKIGNEVQGGEDSLKLNTLADGVTLRPERALLHEIIVQTVTERKIFDHKIPNYDEQFFSKFENLKKTEGYQNLLQKGDFTRDDVTKLLDQAGYEKLPEVPTSQHTTAMVTGGPAIGKTSVVSTFKNEKPELFESAARVNPDDYKAVLASPEKYGRAFADVAHGESSLIAQKILTRMEEKLQAGQAPNVVLDVVSPNESRMNLANQSEHLVVMVGTLPPEQALDRSYGRFLETGRQTPTEVVLGGAQKASKLTPVVLEHNDLNMRVYSTDVPKGSEPRLVASWDSETKTLNVHDPDSFVDFVERQNINPKATSPEELYPKARTPESIATNLSEYTNRGAKVNFLDSEGKVAMSVTPEGVDKNSQLPSKRGNDFFENVGNSHDANVKDVTLTKPVVDGGIKPPSAPDVPHARASAGVGAAGVALGVVGLKNSIEAGDNTGIAVSGLNVGTGALDVGIDAATALGKNAPTVLRGLATKANIAATVVDGVYQISQEEGVNNKVARGAAVGVTTSAALGTIAFVGTATAAAVAAPVVVAVGVGVVADKAVEAYKVTNELDESIKRQERPIKVRNDVEPSGAPKLSNYTHLNLFAVQEGAAVPGTEGKNLSQQDKNSAVRNYEFSKDPAALKDLETRLQAKIDHYNKIIDKNDSWVHDSMRIFGQDEVDAKRMAQIERTQYMAAMNELKDYKKELAGGEQRPKPPEGVKDHGKNLSAVLPAGSTLTVQSSDGNASVARGVLPDSQIKVMQADGQSSATIAEMDRQRNMDALRAAERAAAAAQTLPPQQTSQAQMGAR